MTPLSLKAQLAASTRPGSDKHLEAELGMGSKSVPQFQLQGFLCMQVEMILTESSWISSSRTIFRV